MGWLKSKRLAEEEGVQISYSDTSPDSMKSDIFFFMLTHKKRPPILKEWSSGTGIRLSRSARGSQEPQCGHYVRWLLLRFAWRRMDKSICIFIPSDLFTELICSPQIIEQAVDFAACRRKEFIFASVGKKQSFCTRPCTGRNPSPLARESGNGERLQITCYLTTGMIPSTNQAVKRRRSCP